MKRVRAGGILLHPTSLPGPHGIGDLGPAAHRFVDFLGRAGLGLWQVLPLGPTGFGDSPYQCFSAFAGNPYLVSPEALLEDGLLTRADLGDTPGFPQDSVDFGPVIAHKLQLLDRAHARFAAAPAKLRAAHDAVAAAHANWLDDFALFMALKDALAAPWSEWPEDLARRHPAALDEARRRYAREIDAHRFRQIAFFRQWAALRAHAHAAHVRVIGDIPIFVAHDSADVWAHPELFALDGRGRPQVVAGVPPDYFSPTGQLWGNPLYRWDAIEATGYAWWIDRVRASLELVDIVRLDHFRGFDAHWEIPADAPTAESGRWVPGPGLRLFEALRTALGGDLPIIAEDLGEITPSVEALRATLGLPGMRILQFAFGDGSAAPFLPHNFDRRCVVYTGTHDNDTTRGWYEETSSPAERDFARRYMNTDGHDIAWSLIRLAFASVADVAIVPLQDVLDVDATGRMNLPGRIAGNWGWRFREDALTVRHEQRLRELAFLYDREAFPPRRKPASG